VKPEVAIAQLSIVDGAWQDSPDNVAQFEESALFQDRPGRGSLYLVVEVTGDAEGRDALARELIETARREYAASHGSIMLGLAQAVKAANEFFYTTNANTPPETRRIAGMTAAVLRENELFIAQAGPGLTCLVRGDALQRFPEQSPWFDPNEDAIAQVITSRNFPTEGTVPIGMRRVYNPDEFHITLQPGDVVVLSTRTLAHLLSNEELVDTLANRHPDEIIASLEDLAGTLDLSVIALRLAESVTPVEQAPAAPIAAAAPARPEPAALLAATPTLDENLSVDEDMHESPIDSAPLAEPSAPTPAAPPSTIAQDKPRVPRTIRPRMTLPRVQIDWARVRAALLRATAGTMAVVAAIFSRVDWKKIGAAVDRAISNVSRAFARALLFLLRSFLPGEPAEDAPARVSPPARQAGWRVVALLFPLVLMAVGGWMWFTTRAEQQRVQGTQVTDLLNQSTALVATGKNLTNTDKNAARLSFQQAISLTNQAQAIMPNNAAVRTAYYAAQDELDRVNGISVLLFLPSFATFSDPKASPSRIVTHYPDVYILDRGTSRVYHYLVNDAGPSVTPTPGDGVILKLGDKAGDHTVGDLIDLTLVDQGNRLIAIDKTGAFLEYDPSKSTWSSRAARDSAQWSRVTLLASYAGNLYIVDQGRNQILKYVAADGVWTSSVTYFAPGVAVDLAGVTDIAIDGDVWLARADGSVARFTQGKPNDLAFRELDAPMSKSVAVDTNQNMAGLYVADAGNQRIVQIDKTSGKFLRQFKPSTQNRDAFGALKTLAVDEPNKKFFYINGNQAYLATIPQ
jgi:hypothetical protein